MCSFASIVVIIATLQAVLAVPQGGPIICTSTTTITTTRGSPLHCDIACQAPTSTCSAGESTGPTAPVLGTATSISACTVSEIVSTGPFCGCATCVAPLYPLEPRVTTLPGEQWPRAVTRDDTTTTDTFLGTLPGEQKCSSIATVSTTIRGPVCHPVCPVVTSACAAGEPTGPTPTPPITETATSSCTASVIVRNNPGCNNCATCKSPSYPRATTLPGDDKCPTPTATVTNTASPVVFCNCLEITSCASGQQLTVNSLPTTTLLEGCEVDVIVGPGDCSNQCSSCAYPQITTFPGEQWPREIAARVTASWII